MTDSAIVRRFAIGSSFLMAAWLLRIVAGLSAERVEAVYSLGLYPLVREALGCSAGALPFAVAELLVVVVLLAAVLRLFRALRDARTGLLRSASRLAADALAAAGVVALLFLALWGLNYQRQPLAASTGLDVRPAPTAELVSLADSLVEATNRLRDAQREDGQGAMRTAGTRPDVLDRASVGFSRLADVYPFLGGRCGRPKPMLSSEGFSWLGITGIFVPFTGEPTVNMSVPDSELPFSASHELAHQRGVAREDEANYVAYLACRAHPDSDFNYAGALAASLYALSALREADAGSFTRAEALYSPAVRRDLAVQREWSDRYRGPARRASRRVNDAYLKAQGQREGVRSYGRMVDLLLAERRRHGAGQE